MKAFRVRMFLAGLLALTSVANAELRDGLISYWPFHTVGTETTPDVVSGNHLFLYKVTPTNLVSGPLHQALSLDGVSQFVGLNYATNEKLPVHNADQYTISFWIKGPPNQSNRTVFAEGSTTVKRSLFLLGTHRNGEGASLSVFIRSPTTNLVDSIPSEAVVFDNQWHHIAWVDEGGSGRLYIDGLLDVVSYQYDRQKFPLNYLCAGGLLRDPPMYFFKGAIDELAVWDRALAQNEVQQVMRHALGSMFPLTGEGKGKSPPN